MKKRQLTFEEVKKHIERAGFELLSDEYLRNTQQLEIKCPKKHRFTRSWASINNHGVTCKQCRIDSKLNVNIIQDYLNEKHPGFVALSLCNDQRKHVHIQCPKGHRAVTRWESFIKNESKCLMCFREKERSSRKLLFEQKVKDEDFKVIKYTSSEKERFLRAKVRCNKFHEPYEVRIDNFIAGKRCPHCRNEDAKTWNTNSYEEVKNFIEVTSGSGYKLISEEYVNSDTHITVSCNEGHIYSVRYYNFQTGYRCPRCAGNIKYDFDEVKSYFEKYNYILLSEEYVNNHGRLLVICDKGHETNMSFYGMKTGQRCIKCFYEKNKGEGNANWAGGITSLNKFLRENIKEWKVDSLVSTAYRCDITGTNGVHLEVHHKYPFHNIVEEILTDLNFEVKENIGHYTNEEVSKMVALLKAKHGDCLGAPLLREVHALYHSLFGYKNNTPEEYVYFKENYHALVSGELIPENIH